MEFRLYYLAREGAAAGHRVQIVAASYSHLSSQKPDLQGRKIVDEEIDGIGYRWYATPSYQGNGARGVLNMLSFLRALKQDAETLGSEFKPDVVIASSIYPVDIKTAHSIAKRANAKLVFELHELWPLCPRELGGMPKWHPFIIWLQRAEDYYCRHADL